MEKIKECPVCGFADAAGHYDGVRDSSSIECERCGTFEIGGSKIAGSKIADSLKNAALLSHAIRKMQQRDGDPPLISSDIIKRLLTKELPTVAEQANKLILWFGESANSQEQLILLPEACVSVIVAQSKKALFYVVGGGWWIKNCLKILRGCNVDTA